MRYQQTEVSDFVERLKAMSMHEGVVYGRVRGLELASELYRETISKYGGYGNLADAFLAFFLETMETANALGLALPTISQGYTWFIPRIAHDFRSLRAAEIVTQHGYPYQAYTILRNTFDSVLMTAAALQGVVHWLQVDGIDPSNQTMQVEPEAARRLRISTERKAFSEMTGEKSGLPPETLAAVRHWDGLFNLEVHGGRLSLTASMDWMQGKAPLSLGPAFVEHHFAMYMNRFIEIAWLVHRLLPLVQTKDVELPSRWRDKWRLLDEVFEAMVLSLTVNLGKKIGAAMVELVNLKFPFDVTSRFPDLGPAV